MIAHFNKTTRAGTVRIGGAKSKGPNTPEGLYRSQSARYKHGRYAVCGFRLPGESNREYAERQAHMHAYRRPKGFFDRNLAGELAATTRNSPLCKDQAGLSLEGGGESPSPAAAWTNSVSPSLTSPANFIASKPNCSASNAISVPADHPKCR